MFGTFYCAQSACIMAEEYRDIFKDNMEQLKEKSFQKTIEVKFVY